MKKVLLIMLFVSFVFMGLLYSLTLNCIKAQGYPLYEQVGKEELTDTEKNYYKRKRQGFSITPDNKYKLVPETRRNPQTDIDEKYVTLKDESGSVLWSMESTNEYEERRTFYGSSSGITAVRDYNSTNSFFWVDKQGNELNRLELKDNQTAYVATTLKDGEIWMIQTKFYLREWQFDEGPDENLDVHPNLSSLIFCDRNGNVLNTIDLKYANILCDKTISNDEDYIMYSCYKNIHLENQTVREYQSYLIKYDGSIIKEFDGNVFANGSFSEKEDIYVAFVSTSRIIDVATGDFLASYRAHSRSAVANKETRIVAVLDFYDLYVINYKTKKLLFKKTFDVYPKPKYLEITGDAKEIIVVTNDHLYTFRMKE